MAFFLLYCYCTFSKRYGYNCFPFAIITLELLTLAINSLELLFDIFEVLAEQKTAVWPSMLDEYRKCIEIQLAKELSITRIHQNLQKEFGVKCCYTPLRDYVAKIRKSQPHAYMVLHSLPGEEAQVDFGYIGTLKVNGTPRKAWIFVMSLSHSRYMYVSITPDQSVQTFIRCHTEAFRYFGGVPQTVKSTT